MDADNPLARSETPQRWGARLRVVAMTPDVALAIANGWKYPPPYDFYDATADPEDYLEFVTPAE